MHKIIKCDLFFVNFHRRNTVWFQGPDDSWRYGIPFRIVFHAHHRGRPPIVRQEVRRDLWIEPPGAVDAPGHYATGASVAGENVEMLLFLLVRGLCSSGLLLEDQVFLQLLVAASEQRILLDRVCDGPVPAEQDVIGQLRRFQELRGGHPRQRSIQRVCAVA